MNARDKKLRPAKSEKRETTLIVPGGAKPQDRAHGEAPEVEHPQPDAPQPPVKGSVPVSER